MMVSRRGGRHDLAVVIVTICREALLRCVRSIFDQKHRGPIQIMIGVDSDLNDRAERLQTILAAECPDHVSLVWFDLGYSTSVKHGGVHSCQFGGSLRSALTLLADSEIVMYMDDDDWLAREHCGNILSCIRNKKWAFAYSVYADGTTGEGLCNDEIESVGVGKGVFAEQYGGFVRLSGLAIRKLDLLPIIHLLSASPFASGDGEDRLMFEQLAREPHACTGRSTVYYTLDARDGMHEIRMAFIRSKGFEVELPSKPESVRV